MKSYVCAVALLLAACSAGSSRMPDLADADDIKAVILELDPIAPGGRESPDAVYGLGQPGSDRDLFVRWVRKHAAEDEARHYNIDYRPAPVPGSVNTAIDEQRASDAARAERAKADAVEIKRQQVVQRAKDDQGARETEQRFARQEADAANQREVQRQNEAGRQAKFAACDQEREAAQARQPLSDGYATYRSFECERILQDSE